MKKESSVFEDQFENKNTPAKTTKTSPKTYINNPFLLFVPAIEKLFNLNTNASLWIIGLSFFTSTFYFFGNIFSMLPTSEPSDSISAIAAIIIFVVILLFYFATFVISAMAQFVGYKSSINEVTTLKEAFEVVKKKIWTVLGIQLLTGLKVIVGFLFFIIPGIRAAIRYELALFAMFSEDLGVSASMKRSKELTDKRLMETFSVGTIGSIIPVIGPLLQAAMLGSQFTQLRAYRDNKQELPPTHIASKLITWGLLAFIGFILLIIFIALAVSARNTAY